MFPQFLLTNIASEFQLGDISSYSQLQEGLFGIKFKLVTERGQYFIKTFSPEKTLQRVRSITNAQRLMYERGLPVPGIYPSIKGSHYFTIEFNGSQPVYGCVMEWFEGEDFVNSDASVRDLEVISRSLARINDLAIEVEEHYDWWFTTNLAREWAKKGEYVSKVSEEKLIRGIAETVERFKAIEFPRLTTGVVHGDVGRQNVLKGTNGLCIVDFDAINIDSIAVDLAIAMAQFCFPLGVSCEETFLERYEVMLNEYVRHMQLSDYEIGVLPILLWSSYAIFYIQGLYSSLEQRWHGGEWWMDLGGRGLDMMGRLEKRFLSG